MSRLYKNGIYGIKYKDYYIRSNSYEDESNKTFSILNSDCDLLIDGLLTQDDCKWEVEKLVASKEDLNLLKKLYSLSFPELFKVNEDIIGDKAYRDVTGHDKLVLDYIGMIKNRKKNNKDF